MPDRRTFLIASAAALVASCGGPKPGALTVRATGAPGMNPGPDGTDRPLVVQVVQLRTTAAFEAADAFGLQTPQATLGADVLKVDLLTLVPGAPVTKAIPLDPAVTAIGVVAGFREPGGRAFRSLQPVSPTANVELVIDVGSPGLVVVMG